MGWPKKNEGFRIYRDKPVKGAYLLVDPTSRNGRGFYEGVGEVFTANNPERPALATSSVSAGYIYDNWLPRVSWDDLPPVWQAAFRPWMVLPPECYRGLWSMDKQPQRCACGTNIEQDQSGICCECDLPILYEEDEDAA